MGELLTTLKLLVDGGTLLYVSAAAALFLACPACRTKDAVLTQLVQQNCMSLVAAIGWMHTWTLKCEDVFGWQCWNITVGLQQDL